MKDAPETAQVKRIGDDPERVKKTATTARNRCLMLKTR